MDQSPLETAHNLANVASTAEEQKLAAEAVRIADHEVDLAFASALQQAQPHPPAETSETKELNTRIRFLDSRLQAVQEQVGQLTKLAANPGKNDAHAIQQQLEIAQARVALLQDGLDDAKEDLIRAGGDPQAQIKQELEEHEALQHGSANTSAGSSSKPISFDVEGNLVSQFRTWQRLRNNQARLLEAKQQAETYAATLARKHEALEKGLTDTLGTDDTGPEENGADGPGSHGPNSARRERSPSFTASRRTQRSWPGTTSAFRLSSSSQLCMANGTAFSALQRRVALHAILRSLLWILLALIGLVLAEGINRALLHATGP